MFLIVANLFRIAHHHGIGERLQVVIHDHLAHGTFDLRRKNRIVHNLRIHGFLVNNFFFHPVFQERELGAVIQGIPLRNKFMHHRLRELGRPDRDDNGVITAKKGNVTRDQEKER